MRMAARLFAALLLLLVPGAAAFAHALPGTAAMLDFSRDDVSLELVMPLDQFELAFKHPVMDDPMRVAERYPVQLREYLLRNIHPIAPDGREWNVDLQDLHVEPTEGPERADLVARLLLTPPEGAPLRQFRFDYSVINDEVMTHNVLVFARSDWNNGVFGAEPEFLGTLRFTTTGIDIDRDEGSFWQGLVGVFRLGMAHIAEGTDHLLFLLVLLLPAPLVREGRRRWGGYVGARTTLVRLAKLVTAFTLGHSISLAASVFAPVSLPSQPVEIAIALSILVSALHAWRPVLGGREVWIAAAFGLVHGLAFAQVLAGGGLEGWNKVAAVLGFNLGIEMVQMLVVAAVAPWLMLLARAGRYALLRIGGAVTASLAALAWASERISGTGNIVTSLLENIPAVAPWLFAGLVGAALLAVLAGRSGRIARPA